MADAKTGSIAVYGQRRVSAKSDRPTLYHVRLQYAALVRIKEPCTAIWREKRVDVTTFLPRRARVEQKGDVFPTEPFHRWVTGRGRVNHHHL